MTEQLRVSLLQMDIKIGEPDANFATMERMIAEAASSAEKPDIIVMPEMWNTGYALDRIHQIADRNGERTKNAMSALSKAHQVHIVAGSIAEKRGDDILNTMYVFDRDGTMTAQYSKIHLFRLMEEEKYLTAGDQAGMLDIEGIPAGMMICYDIRFPELSRKLALSGAKMLFVPAEWPNPRLHHWRTLLMARAIENQMYVVSCNRVGVSGTTEFFGHSMIVDPWGEVVAEGGTIETIVTANIDLALADKVRSTIPVFEDRRPNLY